MTISLHSEPIFTPVSVRDAIGRDGWIEYRHDYRRGATRWHRMEFDWPGPALRATLSDWRCREHQREDRREQARKRPSSAAMGYGREWRKASRQFLRETPTRGT